METGSELRRVNSSTSYLAVPTQLHARTSLSPPPPPPSSSPPPLPPLLLFFFAFFRQTRCVTHPPPPLYPPPPSSVQPRQAGDSGFLRVRASQVSIRVPFPHPSPRPSSWGRDTATPERVSCLWTAIRGIRRKSDGDTCLVTRLRVSLLLDSIRDFVNFSQERGHGSLLSPRFVRPRRPIVPFNV